MNNNNSNNNFNIDNYNKIKKYSNNIINIKKNIMNKIIINNFKKKYNNINIIKYYNFDLKEKYNNIKFYNLKEKYNNNIKFYNLKEKYINIKNNFNYYINLFNNINNFKKIIDLMNLKLIFLKFSKLTKICSPIIFNLAFNKY